MTTVEIDPPEERQARWEGAAKSAGRVLDERTVRFCLAMAAGEISLMAGAWERSTAPADRSLGPVLPAWEAMYEPGNVSDYLIGYANSEAAAKGAAEAWLRSEKDDPGRLEWVPQRPLDGYDAEFELVEHHDDGIDTGPGITVRRRTTPAP
ncbi:hypothetical protein OG785_45325 [Streptomyces sp. NBC_00006]|uniref:hypothetical protein n=1 Tax=Streptomyces sp. NBC_00006 TaxID=2975619 RepID=UPI00225B87DF|nr:hypothetical protein [Streptomyces sp. NBC_00006]MCX5528987.1 hypothetical protein [Streptomyces sp. NBC_00006]MCX5537781.1 hypothetical protein [Streptomyces sp. NBC_00006]